MSRRLLLWLLLLLAIAFAFFAPMQSWWDELDYGMATVVEPLYQRSVR